MLENGLRIVFDERWEILDGRELGEMGNSGLVRRESMGARAVALGEESLVGGKTVAIHT